MRLHRIVHGTIVLAVNSMCFAQAPVPVPSGSDTDEPVAVVRAASDDDEFDQALSALRQELTAVRDMRQTPAVSQDVVDLDDVTTTVQQRRMLLNLLQKLATVGPKKTENVINDQLTETGQQDGDGNKLPLLIQGGQTIDNFALGRTLFRDGEYARAEEAFRNVPNDGANEWYLNYLIACCLRKQGKFNEAVALYQNVVLQSNDSSLEESSRWQIQNIRWRQSMESQLQRLRDVRSQGDDTSATATETPAETPTEPATEQPGI